MKARKLIRQDVLKQLTKLTRLGVPVARAMRELSIDNELTRPTVVRLLKAHRENYHSSVFPKWLDPNGTIVQEQPDNYTYFGFFPYGSWECKQ